MDIKERQGYPTGTAKIGKGAQALSLSDFAVAVDKRATGRFTDPI
jgi:hypothetical protein